MAVAIALWSLWYTLIGSGTAGHGHLLSQSQIFERLVVSGEICTICGSHETKAVEHKFPKPHLVRFGDVDVEVTNRDDGPGVAINPVEVRSQEHLDRELGCNRIYVRSALTQVRSQKSERASA